MRLLNVICLFFILTEISQAQPIIITLTDGTDVTNSSFTVFGNPLQDLFETDAYVKNNSDTTLKLRVRRREISVNPQTENYFCWFQCYGPSVSVDPTNNFILVQFFIFFPPISASILGPPPLSLPLSNSPPDLIHSRTKSKSN